MMLSGLRPIRVLLLPAAMVVVVGCASRAELLSAGAPSSASSERTSNPVVVHADYGVFFQTPSEIFRLSDEVVIGTVEGERRGETYGPSDAPRQNRILEVSVERSLKGSSSSPVEVATYGWTKINGEERVLVTSDGVRLKVGDRAMLALAVGKDGGRGLANDQAVLLLADGQVVDSDRYDPLVKQLEALSEPQLVDLIQRR